MAARSVPRRARVSTFGSRALVISGLETENPMSGAAEASSEVSARRSSAEQSVRVVETAEAQWSGVGSPEAPDTMGRGTSHPAHAAHDWNTLEGTRTPREVVASSAFEHGEMLEPCTMAPAVGRRSA